MDAAADEQGGERPGACVQCVERCQREHRASGGGSQFASSDKHPSFLRTVLEHNVRHNMAIPKSFVKMHGKSLPGSTVDLEGANGKVWLVTVVTSSTGTAFFRFGWHVFAEDNNLKLGDAVLFTMVAKNRFTVRVFGKNGLEPLNPTNAISHDSTPTPNVGAFHLNDSDDEIIHSGGSENGREPGSLDTLTIQELIQTAHVYSAGEDSARRPGSGKPRRPKRRRRSPDAQQGNHVEVPGANSTLFASRRRIVTNEERERAQEEARKIMATLARPSVEVVMMPSHVYRGFWLSIPHAFSRQHLPCKRMPITLRDAQGGDWGAEYIGDVDHSALSGGWAAFSKDHCLEEGDVCIFELLDSKKFIFLVHICRVVEVPSVLPTRRGLAAWEVTYNIIKRDPPPLPDLNDLAKPEPDATPPNKQSHLASVLHEMIRSGQFSNMRKEEYDALPSKIRALAENSQTEDGDEDVKPDVKGISSQFKRPNTPLNVSSEFSIKAEPEDVHCVSPAGQPSYTAPNCRPTTGVVEVKAEPMYIFKPEDASTGERELSLSLSPVAVYSRRRRKDVSNSVANSVSFEIGGESKWYPVVRLLRKRQREGQAEKEFLVDIMGTVAEKDRSSHVEQGPDGLWWVPSSQFASDLSACFFR